MNNPKYSSNSSNRPPISSSASSISSVRPLVVAKGTMDDTVNDDHEKEDHYSRPPHQPSGLPSSSSTSSSLHDHGLELNPNMHTTIRSYLEQYTADDFELLDKLYINGDSIVYKARWKTVPSGFFSPFVAIKQRLTSELGRNADVLHEAKLNVRHPHIVRCYGSYWKPVTSLNMIFEWADGGDLLSIVRNRRQRYNLLPEYDIWRWSFQLFSALDCLHRRRIIHRDIKCSNLLLFSRENAKQILIQHLQQMDPASFSIDSSVPNANSIHTSNSNAILKPNVLLGPMAKNAIKGNPIASTKLSSTKTINKDSLLASLLTSPDTVPLPSPSEYPFLYDLKVADLGVARRLGMGGEFANTMYGTPLYMSPELVDVRGPNYTNKTDVWSAGVSIYEIAALTSPFTGNSMAQLTNSVRAGRYKPLPSFYSKELHDFIRLCLQVDPDKRPNSRDALDICTNWLNKQNNGAGDIEAIRQGAVTDRRAILRGAHGSSTSKQNTNNAVPFPQQQQLPVREKAQDTEGAETRALMYPDRILADENLSLVARAKATAAAARNFVQHIEYEENGKGSSSISHSLPPSRPRTAPSTPTRSIPASFSSNPAGIVQTSINVHSPPSGPTASVPLIDGPIDPYVSGKLIAQQIQNNPKVIRVKVRRKGHAKGETLHVEAPLPPPTPINEYGIPEEDEENSFNESENSTQQLPLPPPPMHSKPHHTSPPSVKHHPSRAKSPVIVVPTSPRSSEVRYMPVPPEPYHRSPHHHPSQTNNREELSRHPPEATSYDIRPPSARFTNLAHAHPTASSSSSRPSTASSVMSKSNSITNPTDNANRNVTNPSSVSVSSHRNNADIYAERDNTNLPVRSTKADLSHNSSHYPSSNLVSARSVNVPSLEISQNNSHTNSIRIGNSNDKLTKAQPPLLLNQKLPAIDKSNPYPNSSSSSSQTYLSYQNDTNLKKKESGDGIEDDDSNRNHGNNVIMKDQQLRQWRQEASERRAEIAERNKERWQRELAAAGVL